VAALAERQGDLERAAQLAGWVDVQLRTLTGIFRMRDRYIKTLAALRAGMEPSDFELAWARGCSMSTDAAFAIAGADGRRQLLGAG
jgi:hypothetical protein